jgi:hypothetical protein
MSFLRAACMINKIIIMNKERLEISAIYQKTASMIRIQGQSIIRTIEDLWQNNNIGQ